MARNAGGARRLIPLEPWPTPPEGALPWPARIPEPRWDAAAPAVDVPDGLYYSAHPSGRMRLLASVKRGVLDCWLQLGDGEHSGCFKSEGGYWFVQRYYPEGLVEDFARDDDTSKPYPPEQGFLQWATGYRDQMAAPPPEPPDWLAENMRLFEQMQAGDRPPAHADQVLSGGVPDDLEERLPEFADLSWHSPMQCHERLLHYFKWEPELARDFTNFATAACASAVLDSPGPETFLSPRWDAEPGWIETPLEEVEMYRRVRKAAREVKDRRVARSWVRALAECCPWTYRQVGRLPAPIVWTVPPPGPDGVELTRIACELLLRQAATDETKLEPYLARVDRDRFFRAAGVAGAFLQATRATSALPPALPLEGPKILRSLGEWVHSQASDRPVEVSDRPVVDFLGRFFNDRSDRLREAMAAFRQGEPWWSGGLAPSGWPWQEEPRHRLGRARTEEFLEDFGVDPGAEGNRFLVRAETAFRRLASGPWKAQGIEADMLADLEPALAPLREGYPRWVAAARWALRPLDADERHGVALAHLLLSGA